MATGASQGADVEAIAPEHAPQGPAGIARGGQLPGGERASGHKFDPTALLFKGLILETENDLGRAVDYYSRSWTHGNPAALPRLVDLLVRLERWEDLTKLRQSDTSNQVGQIEAITCVQHDHKDEALKIVEQSLRERPATQGWQIGMLNLLGEGNKVEALLRQKAEQQPEQLEPWLTLLKYQATHGKTEAAAETIARVKQHVKSGRPELTGGPMPIGHRRLARGRQGHRSGPQAIPSRCRGQDDRRAVLPGDGAYRSHRGVPEASTRTRPERSHRGTTTRHHPFEPTRNTGNRRITLLGPEENVDLTRRTPGPGRRVRTRRATPSSVNGRSDMLTELMNDLQAENSVAIAARDVLARLLFATGQPAAASKIAAVAAQADPSPSNIALYAETLIQSEQFDAAQAQLDRLARMVPGNRRGSQPPRPSGRISGPEAAREGRRRPGEGLSRSRDKVPVPRSSAGKLSGYFSRAGGRIPPRSRSGWGSNWPRTIPGSRGCPRWSWPARGTARMPSPSAAPRSRPGRAAKTCVRPGGSCCPSPSRPPAEAHRSSNKPTRSSRILTPCPGRRFVARHQGDDRVTSRSRFADEVRLYRAVLERQPQNPVVLNNIAWALSEGMNQPSEAMEQIDELVRIAGRGAETLDTRGVILTRMSRLDEAIKDLEEAVKVSPTGIHLFHLAQAYQKAGRDAEFRKTRDQVRLTGLTSREGGCDRTARVRSDHEQMIDPTATPHLLWPGRLRRPWIHPERPRSRRSGIPASGR